MHTRRVASLWLLFGALSGIALAGIDILEPNMKVRLDDGTMALVNGVPVSLDRYRAIEQGLERERGGVLASEERARIVARLIEEELLVQRGVELGLVRQNALVRNTLVRTVTEAVASQQAASEPLEDELEVFFRENQDFFATGERLRIHRILFDGYRTSPQDAERRAERASDALRDGLPFQAAKSRFGDEDVYPLPDAPLPAPTLSSYIGPVMLQAAQALEEGEISALLRSGSNFQLLQLVERLPGDQPTFSQSRDRVLVEWQRRHQEAMLREYIDWLRARADVSVGLGEV